MKRVVLIFPDTASLAEFLVHYHIQNAEVDSIDQSLTAPLLEEQILIAIHDYGAIKKEQLIKSFDYGKPYL
jgi:hypothetical protein